jgi:hypothetical protein
MRIFLVALCCAIGLAASGGSGAAADDKADLEKEVKKFQGAWTIESNITGGKEIPPAELKGFIVIFEGDKLSSAKTSSRRQMPHIGLI